MDIICMGTHGKSKDFGMISRTLYSEINAALEKKQQSIVLHNRLGEGIKKIG